MPPGRRTWTLAFLILTSSVLAGCTAGGPSYVKSKFQDADQRIAQAADGGYSQSFDIIVPPAAPALTVRASMLADQGIGFALRNPGGRLTTSFDYPAHVEIPELTWLEPQRPAPGNWRLGVDCDRKCDFSFGFYLSDAVPKPQAPLPTYDDATIRFVEDTDGASNRVNEFRLPANVSSLSIRTTVAAQDGVTMHLEDPMGGVRANLGFPGRAWVDDASYLVLNDPQPGTWSFRANCREGCGYGLGVYVK